MAPYLSLFLSLSFAGPMSPISSFFLSFSFSIFRICGHDNYSSLNTFDNTDTETISAFRFLLYWLFGCLCFNKTRVTMRFPAKITSCCIWVIIPFDWVVLYWYACGADERADGHVITKISRIGRLPHFRRYGATLARVDLLQKYYYRCSRDLLVKKKSGTSYTIGLWHRYVRWTSAA